MTPNVHSSWITVNKWNSPITLRNQRREQEKLQQRSSAAKPSISSKELRLFQPRADYDPIQRIDVELAKLREAASKVFNEKRRFVVRVELGTFRPESVQVFIESEKLSIRCEEELQIDEKTTIVKRFTRRIPIPTKQLRTEMIATQMNSLGTLTITLLKH